MWQSLRIHHKTSSYSEHLLTGTCSFYLSIKGVLTTFIQLTEEYLLFLTLEGPTIPVASTESWMKKKYSKAREEIISIWYWAGTQLEIQAWPSFWWCLLRRKSPDKKSEVCWGVINHFINLDIHNMHYKSGSSTSGDHTTMQTVQPFWSFWQRTLGLLFF